MSAHRPVSVARRVRWSEPAAWLCVPLQGTEQMSPVRVLRRLPGARALVQFESNASELIVPTSHLRRRAQ